ncbi:37S ribosomal protein MRP21 [Zymoseptoria brevis]|uniref:37S ribosomal protein MRP21 n=1 Tax=Zymoseptoria brevis TaxID=1047168 RepID=A0A0F4H1S4_9PEZI|nr:37S ribosomal protein MRP21 [Zymoseptoria brevis]
MDIGKMLEDTLSGDKSPVANRTSRTPSSGTAKSSDAILANRPREGNSFDVFTSGMSSAYPSPLASQGSQMDRMIPSSPLGLAPSIDIVEPPMKLNSSTGRQVRVDPERRMDVGRAFRSLEILCARNSVKRDFMRQRFHERPGLKRKRLKSERWRKNFKAGFKETVRMVMKMKKQGW